MMEETATVVVNVQGPCSTSVPTQDVPARCHNMCQTSTSDSTNATPSCITMIHNEIIAQASGTSIVDENLENLFATSNELEQPANDLENNDESSWISVSSQDVSPIVDSDATASCDDVIHEEVKEEVSIISIDDESLIESNTMLEEAAAGGVESIQESASMLVQSQDAPSTSGLNVEASCDGKKWVCEMCTLLNEPCTTRCDACGFVPPDSTKCHNCQNKKSHADYLKLLELEDSLVITNTARFECKICYTECQPGEGNILRNCLHSFCRDCLSQTVEFSDDIEVKCPFKDDNYSCTFTLQDREIKHIVSPEIYEKHLTKSLSITENRMKNTFHCKLANCTGWCIIDDVYNIINVNANVFACPVCQQVNCIPCQAIHKNMSCRQYQESLGFLQETAASSVQKTLKYIDEMKQSKIAMNCPTCKVNVVKDSGCDGIQCPLCKTHICWATRGPRWGPNGVGDKSGGCGCERNRKCTPTCNNCH